VSVCECVCVFVCACECVCQSVCLCVSVCVSIHSLNKINNESETHVLTKLHPSTHASGPFVSKCSTLAHGKSIIVVHL